jgi:glycosyltransferase involved in cell wall biosynthesis
MLKEAKPYAESISVLIHTKNSESTLAATLDSISWADEVLVIDMHSSDKTVSLAKKHGATVITVDDVGYVEPARNIAIKAAKFPWILIVDSDEIIASTLAKHLQSLAKGAATSDAYLIPRKNQVFGDWISTGGWWPDYQLRFFKKGIVHWPEQIHSQPKIDGSVEQLPLKEELAIEHANYPTVSSFLERLDRYTTHEVHSRSQIKPSKAANSETLVTNWSNELLRRLFAFEGIKGGTRGIGVSFLQAMYEFVVVLKFWEKNEYAESSSNSEKQTIVQLGKFKSDLQYWIADWHVKNTSGLPQIWWRMRRSLKL